MGQGHQLPTPMNQEHVHIPDYFPHGIASQNSFLGSWFGVSPFGQDIQQRSTAVSPSLGPWSGVPQYGQQRQQGNDTQSSVTYPYNGLPPF